MLSRVLGSVALAASAPVIVVPVVTIAVVLVTVFFTATIREERNFNWALGAESKRHIHGMIVDRRR